MSADYVGICPLCLNDAFPNGAGSDVLNTFPRTAEEQHEIGLDGHWPHWHPTIRLIYTVKCRTCGATAKLDTTVTMQRPLTMNSGERLVVPADAVADEHGVVSADQLRVSPPVVP